MANPIHHDAKPGARATHQSPHPRSRERSRRAAGAGSLLEAKDAECWSAGAAARGAQGREKNRTERKTRQGVVVDPSPAAGSPSVIEENAPGWSVGGAGVERG